MDMQGFSKFFGERLREERAKLGLNQQEFAEKCSIAKNTYFNYEKGERKPDIDTVMKFYLLGMDIFYLFTNQKSVVAENYEERALLKMFRNLNGDDKRAVLMSLEQKRIDAIAFGDKSAVNSGGVSQQAVRVFDLNEEGDGIHTKENKIVGNNNIVAGRDVKR